MNRIALVAFAAATFGAALSARTGVSDLTQTPNAVNEGIYKSLQEQVGAEGLAGPGRGPAPRRT